MWHYTQAGLYYRQVKSYLNVFDPDQLRIYLFCQDFKYNKEKMLQDIFDFLEVDNTLLYTEVLSKQNSYPKPDYERNKILTHIMMKNSFLKNNDRVFLPSKIYENTKLKVKDYNFSEIIFSEITRIKLTEFFNHDILLLQDLLERDLSSWL